jgi:hypothetical protein
MVNYNKLIVSGKEESIIALSNEEQAEREAEEKEWDDAEPDRAFELLREKRDKLLIATDFYTLPDRPTTISSEMSSYRQQLRDFPSTFDNESILTFVIDDDSGWPTKPE